MPIEILINPLAPGYAELQRGLRDELSEIKEIHVSEVSAPPPPKTLTIGGDILKFIIDHPATFSAVKAMIELIRSVVERKKISQSKNQPSTVIVVGDLALPVPSSPQNEARFLKKLEKGDEGNKAHSTRTSNPQKAQNKKSSPRKRNSSKQVSTSVKTRAKKKTSKTRKRG